MAKTNLLRYEEAIKDYNEAIKRAPTKASSYYLRAISKKKLGRYDEAIEDYDEAIACHQQKETRPL